MELTTAFLVGKLTDGATAIDSPVLNAIMRLAELKLNHWRFKDGDMADNYSVLATFPTKLKLSKWQRICRW